MQCPSSAVLRNLIPSSHVSGTNCKTILILVCLIPGNTGKVIGINTASLGSGVSAECLSALVLTVGAQSVLLSLEYGGTIGVGFAIPIDAVGEVVIPYSAATIRGIKRKLPTFA
eukprot:264622-Rhodomonas_salina.2